MGSLFQAGLLLGVYGEGGEQRVRYFFLNILFFGFSAAEKASYSFS